MDGSNLIGRSVPIVEKVTVGGVDLDSFKPAAVDNFGASGTMYASLAGGIALHAFYFLVCTPLWLHSALSANSPDGLWSEDAEDFSEQGSYWGKYYLPMPERGVMFGTGLLLVTRWSPAQVRNALDGLCRREEGSSFSAISSRLGRIVPWENDYGYDRD